MLSSRIAALAALAVGTSLAVSPSAESYEVSDRRWTAYAPTVLPSPAGPSSRNGGRRPGVAVQRCAAKKARNVAKHKANVRRSRA